MGGGQRALTGDDAYGAIRAAPISFAVDARQYIAIAAGYALFVFGLP